MTYILDLPNTLPERRTLVGAVGRVLVRLVRDRLHAWMVWRTVQTLRSMDDRTLEDIGIPRGEIEFRVRELMPRDHQ